MPALYEILEALMLVCFGLSWPMNVIKHYRSREVKGISLQFIFLIILGYVAGLTAKLMKTGVSFVVIVYIINLLMVFLDLCVYIRNKRLAEE